MSKVVSQAGSSASYRRRRRGVAAVAALAVALGTVGALSASAQAGSPRDQVQQGLERMVKDEGYPAALASVTGKDGRSRDYAAGVADIRTRKKAPVDGQVRAGSNTKTFVATVVLQLVGEGKVELDAPIERYLANLVRGEGIDGRNITVRQLLQHTSGLPNYVNIMRPDLVDKDLRHTYYQPRQLLDVALAHKASFEPGKGVEYSNTNTVLAGLIAEKVTGRPLAEQITQRVIERAGLRDTYIPDVGEQGIRKAHPQGYIKVDPSAQIEDITEIDPSWGWAAGNLVSTPGDLTKFFSALIGGKLLNPVQLAEMRRTVKGPWGLGEGFGLGLISRPLSCDGTLSWGHGGDIPGYTTRVAVTDDGRAASVAVTLVSPGRPDSAGALVDAALCAKR
ncbi:serine hydrolase domain-containing protein [Longispora albida]|uniref:serine hydrolase domain-containing protein n=1 Tax=Longispora albida TaxID=203523 RepID=UPI0003A31103|nr:serine hydrolase domain-containing protein [Longispora albida]